MKKYELEELKKEATDILNLSYLKNPAPEFMPKQKQLIEFARKSANYILKLK
jgi:hypothetical protein